MTERTLTPEAQLERDQFDRKFGSDGNCSCHLSPPCGSCTHPGNPRNQEEDETAWVTESGTDAHKTVTKQAGSTENTHKSGSVVDKPAIRDILEFIVGAVRHYGECVAKARNMEAQPQDDAAADEALRNIEARVLLALSNFAGSSCAECGKTHGDGWALYCVDCCMVIQNLLSLDMPGNLRELIKALGVQRPLDTAGIEVAVNRWAVDKAANMLAAHAARPTFQSRVAPWMQACFGPEISADRMERNHRFFEEATELVQANQMTRSEAHQLVDYVFNRPVGQRPQEVGGVMVTLAALCLANGNDMHECGEVELARISDPVTIEKIRAKQAAKPRHSPLPEAVPAALIVHPNDDDWERRRAATSGNGTLIHGNRRPAPHAAAPMVPSEKTTLTLSYEDGQTHERKGITELAESSGARVPTMVDFPVGSLWFTEEALLLFSARLQSQAIEPYLPTVEQGRAEWAKQAALKECAQHFNATINTHGGQTGALMRALDLAYEYGRGSSAVEPCESGSVVGSNPTSVHPSASPVAVPDTTGMQARMRASGMYGLLSEILGSGALRQHYGTDHDIIDRVKMACAEQESAMRTATHPALPDAGLDSQKGGDA